MDDIGLVPAHRLGALLRDHREHQGRSLRDVAHGSRYSAWELRRVEGGGAALDVTMLEDLCALYGVSTAALVPRRTDLVVDRRARTLRAGGRVATWSPGDAADVDAILRRYVALVYALRGIAPGVPLHFRSRDITALAEALDVTRAEIHAGLDACVEDAQVRAFARALRRHVVVPEAGVLLASTSEGALVFVDSEEPPPRRPARPAPLTTVPEADGSVVSLVDAALVRAQPPEEQRPVP